ncbi:MAG: hypothetical protein ABUS57_13495 [Pseudomonadota bacterium]
MSRLVRTITVAAIGACLVLAGCDPKPATTATETAAAPATTTDAIASAKPQIVGDCVETSVTSVGPRLEGAPTSGSAVQYANGMSQVDYDAVPGIDHSKAGDAVRVCLVSVPENCPAGDDRGRVYAATNLRTNETWSAPDSEHSCGGA